MNDRSQPPSEERHCLRFTRRDFARTLAGGVLLVTGACKHGSAAVPADPTSSVEPLNPDWSDFPSVETTPNPPSTTRVARSTPAAGSPTATIRPEPQILYQGGFSVDPVSHDFNANLYCGGDPSLFSGLLTLNTDLTPMGDWAENWEPNNDSSKWTFHLRRDNRGWSNGNPVTAQDFVWSWQRLLSPKTQAPHAWLLYDIVNAVQVHAGKDDAATLGVRAIDSWTLQVDLIGPRVYFPSIVATIGTVPAYQPAVESYGDKWTEEATCVSNGPFTLARWQHGDQWTTVPNTGHWNVSSLRLEETIVPITPPEKHQQPYFNELVDFMPVAADDVANVRSISDYNGQMSGSTDPAIWFLIVNPSVPPFDDLGVRQAVAHAIDRDRLEQLSEGRASSAHSLIPSTFPVRGEDDTIKTLQQFDVDHAIRLLSVTKYAHGTESPPITLLTSENTDVAQLLANDCAKQLFENLGMNVDVKTVSSQEYDSALTQRTAALYWHRWDFTYPDPNNGYGDAFFPIEASASLLPLVPPNFGDLIGRGKVEQNPAARASIYRQCESALQTSVSYIPIAYPVTFYLIRPWVAGFPLVGDSSVLQPGRIFTRLTSLVSIKGRPLG